MLTTTSYSVSGKVAIVTGAMGGIGQAISNRLLSEGAKVVFADIKDDETGQEHIDQLNFTANSRVATYIRCDVRKPDNITSTLNHAVRTFGRLDILVNNAGIGSLAPLYETETFATISAILEVNLRAPIEFTRQFVHYINEHQSEFAQGVVLNIASTTAYHQVPNLELYMATKAALINYTESTGFLAPRVRVSAIAPCFVDSPLVRNSRLFDNPKWLWVHGLVSLEQVANAAMAVIKDENAAAKTFTVIGNWAVCANMRVREITLVILYAICAYSAIVAWIFGVKPPNKYVTIRPHARSTNHR